MFAEQMRGLAKKGRASKMQCFGKPIFRIGHQNEVLTARERKVVRLLLDLGPKSFEGGVSTRTDENIQSR